MIWSIVFSSICFAPVFVSHTSAKRQVVGKLHIFEEELTEDGADDRGSDEKSLIQTAVARTADVSLAREAVTKHHDRLIAQTNTLQSMSEGSVDKNNAHMASHTNSWMGYAIRALLIRTRMITVSSEMPTFPRLLCKGILLIIGVWLFGWSVGWIMARSHKSQMPVRLEPGLDVKYQQPEPQACSSESGSDIEGARSHGFRGSQSFSDPEKQPDPTFCEILFAVLIYAPGLGVLTVLFIALVIVQQILVLPFRLCGGKPLAFALNVFAPLMSSAVFLFVTGSTGEPCYGRAIDRDRVKSFADFLQLCSASRRKNIKRNLRAAEQVVQTSEFEVSYHEAGSWRITPEMRTMIWDQCEHHITRVFGWPDIMNCQQPVSPRIMYIGEILLLLAFACDIQLVKTKDGKLVSLNTRVHVGDVLFNPNYATDPDHAQDGIYAWVSHDLVEQAIKLRVSMVNLMPSMRPAKKILGMRSLHLGSLICLCWNCASRRSPPKVPIEEPREPQRVLSQAEITAAGGKRAARKRAANLAASTDSSPRSPQRSPKREPA